MKWSWKLGEFAGIGVYVHATFFLIIIWIAVAHWVQGASLAMMLSAIAFILVERFRISIAINRHENDDFILESFY